MGIIIKPPNLTDYQEKILKSKARFTITEASTKSGKTHSHILWLYREASKGKNNDQYWWIAPIYSQSMIAFKRMRANLRKTGIYKFNVSSLSINFPNGAEMHFKSAEKADNLFGENVHAAVFDEAPRSKVDSWYALRTTLSSTGGKCKLIGNFGGISNWVHKLKDKAKTDPEYEYFKITCWDAIREGIMKESEVLQAKKDLPDKIFKELYEAEASESDGQLISNESIKKIFSNTHIPGGVKYISADIARLGNDKTVVMVWDDLKVIDVQMKRVSRVNESVELIKSLQIKHNVNNDKTIVDEDGVGGGVVDYLKCMGFVNNSKPVKVKGKIENFANLKSQCGYHLAEVINRNEIYVDCDEETERFITEELEWIRLPKEIDVQKIRLLTKDEIKKQLGRSPDYSDSLMMRMYFDVNPNKGKYAVY
jgi:hypothetical protein